MKFAALGEQSRVPAFRPSQTLWAASEAVGEGVTHQECDLLLHSLSHGFVPWHLLPFLQLQCCFQRSLEGESDGVQAEHDARPAFLALDFLARLRSTVTYVRRHLHRRALFTTLLSATCFRASSLVAARLRRNATHTSTYGGPSCS